LQKGEENIVITLEIQSSKNLPKKLPLFIVKILSQKILLPKRIVKKIKIIQHQSTQPE
jgi:hypothetical protein